MTAIQILILALVAMLVNRLKRGRSLGLMAVSALVIYWLQPVQEPVNLVFWFPTLTLILAVLFWLVTSTDERRGWKENRGAVLTLAGVILLVDLNRVFQFEQFFISDTPRVQLVVIVLMAVSAVGLLLARVKSFPHWVLWLGIMGLIAALVLLKSPSVLGGLIEAVAGLRGKEAGGVSALSWLGFSYVAFRLMHTVLDRIAGRLPSVPLADFVNYVIFFPAFTAGPIDRLERFMKTLHEPAALDSGGWLEAGTRLTRGLFKKFVLADGLAWFALSDLLAPNVQSMGWLWVLLYAYSLRIYLDFSGYTDIAIGLGRLIGIRLPENFDAPYLKPNLTQFWNAWHMTLTQWFRSYFFNPLTRAMRSARRPMPQWLMIFLAQLATMTLIGMWHGLSVGFILWGLWHGVGLFIHNRWSDWVKSRGFTWNGSLVKYAGMFITFHYVTLGWLFFFLPDPALAWTTLFRLLGVA
jgi:D-alanyl-lipoteichoic acid acyltransferase DltB (MBOAT superfamily)